MIKNPLHIIGLRVAATTVIRSFDLASGQHVPDSDTVSQRKSNLLLLCQWKFLTPNARFYLPEAIPGMPALESPFP